MVKTIETRAVISAQDKTGATFAQVAQKLKQMEGVAKRANAHVAASAGRVAAAQGRVAAIPAGVKAVAGVVAATGVVHGISKALHANADLETAMIDLGNTTGASAESIGNARKSFEMAAPRLGAEAKELASVAQGLAAAGVDFETATKAAPIVVKTAKASRTSFQDATSAAASLVTNLGIDAANLEKGLEQIYTGGKAGRFELKEAGQYLPEIAAKGSQLGYKGTEGAAAIAAMAKIVRDEAGSSSEAKTNLSAAYSYITSPEFGKNLMKDFKIDRDKLVRDSMKAGTSPFDAVIDAMRAKGIGADPIKLSNAVRSDEARKAFSALLKDDYRPLRDKILSESGGSIEKDFGAVMSGAQASFDKMSASANTVATGLGEAFAPALKSASNAMVDLAGWITSSKDAIAKNLEERFGKPPALAPTPVFEGPFDRDPDYGRRNLPLRRPPSFASQPIFGKSPFAPPSQEVAPMQALGITGHGGFGLKGPQGQFSTIAGGYPMQPQKTDVSVHGEADVNVSVPPIEVRVSMDTASVIQTVRAEVSRATAQLRQTSSGVGSTGSTDFGNQQAR